MDTLQQSQIGPTLYAKGTQTSHNCPCPLPGTLEPRVDECSFEVQSTVLG